jgi:hypothetical protein
MTKRNSTYTLSSKPCDIEYRMKRAVDLAERLDINKQYTTKALLYLLVACGEVRRSLLLVRSADSVAGRLPPVCDECTVS